MRKNPLVSIIIPTYNSERTIGLLLESIRRQTYQNIEVIVVDGFSKDRTVDIAMRYSAKVIRTHGERARAKNVGLKEAHGDYVMFIDSDMILTPGVVGECVAVASSHPKIGGVVIPERSVGMGYWVAVRDFERSFYANTPIESPRFFPTKLAIEAGGFDEDVVFFEEATLPKKIEEMGYYVRARIKSPILHYEGDFSLKRWIWKKYYYSKTAKLYIRRYKKIAMYQVNPIYRISLFYNKKIFEKPQLAVGVLLLKTLEYTASIVGYIL